jgi:hypothetical protein
MSPDGAIADIPLIRDRLLRDTEGDEPPRCPNPTLPNVDQATDAPHGIIIGEPLTVPTWEKGIGLRKLVCFARWPWKFPPSGKTRELL